MVKKKISRLEEDLKKAKQQINRLAVENKSKIRGDEGSTKVKTSLKLMNEFQLEKKRLEEEVSFLKTQNKDLGKTIKNREPERA
jgi:hypothetical protein